MEIITIPIEKLKHHPENPRKDLGDLTELADSIKENGIMQNLTVVHDNRSLNGEFLVVIGNRRMEAAKIAGLKNVPCVISEMDHREQIATMLMENMQRTDLTVYEQAQGFQMMMDLGFSAEEIGEKTGFSDTTVRRRLKMAELDKATFEQAVGKQITIEDLDKLGQVEDLEKRNELLSLYGDRDFEWKLMTQIKKQKAEKVRPKAMEMLKAAKLKTIDREDTWKTGVRKLYDQTCELDKWDGKKNFIPKTEEMLFYCVNGMDIDFYVKEKKQKAEPVKKTPEEIEEEKRIELAWKSAKRAEEAAWELREKFAEGMKVTPKNAMEMLQWALAAAMDMIFSYDTPTSRLRKTIPIETYNTEEILKSVNKWVMDMPQSGWPAVILRMFHGEGDSNRSQFVCGSQKEWPKHCRNQKMEHCYIWLTQFGYEMSTEEIQMMSGTHPVFQTEVTA